MRAGGRHQPWVVVVPTAELQQKLVGQAHAAGRAHANAQAMERELRKKYWWWGMREMCAAKVNECVSCQRNKVRTRLSFGKMAEIEEPATMGIAYSIDFLTNLPPATSVGYSCLMMIRDRWSRRVFAIPCKDTTTASQAALLFFNEICVHQCRGIPVWLQMDRDPRFRSAWFREFYRLSGVHLHFTTGYKSQSNGLVENCNRTMSQMLRNASADQRSWWNMWKLAVMYMNCTVQARLGCCAMEAENGVRPKGVLDFDPNLLHEVDGEIVVNPAMTDGQHSTAVKAQIDKMLSYRAAIEENRAGLQEDMMRRYDRRYLQLKGLEQGALVMVEAKHISIPARRVKGLMDCEKLQPRWFGPYRVAAWHNECDVEIERGGQFGLHPRSRVHPVFHVSKVKPYDGDAATAKPPSTDFGRDDAAAARWEVMAILDHRGEKAMGRRKSTLEYFVQWTGFNVEDYTWEREADVIGTGDSEGANEMVDEYWKRVAYLESRRHVVTERTADTLIDDDMTDGAATAGLFFVAAVKHETPGLIYWPGYCRYDFDAGRLCGRAGAHRAESAWQRQTSRVPGMA